MVVGFSLASTLPVLAVWCWAYSSLLEKEFSRVNEHHFLIAKEVSGDLEQYFHQVTNALAAYGPEIAERGNPTFASQLFETYKFQHICVFDRHNWRLQYGFLEETLAVPKCYPAFATRSLKT